MFLSPICRLTILILIAGVVVFLSSNPLEESFYGKGSDEGYYYHYASLVVVKGKSAFNDLLTWYVSSEKAILHPAPIRAGYVFLSAFLFKLCHEQSFGLLGLISTFSFFIFLYLCFYYIRRYFDFDTALISVLFLVSSPLMLGLSRRALIDSSSNLLWAMALWLFLDVLFKPNRSSYAFFLTTLFIAITFKESSLVLIPFFVIAGIVGRCHGAAINSFQIVGIIIFPLVFLVLFYGWIYGGADALRVAVMTIVKAHFSSHYPNPYAVNYCSGPWFKYLLDFFLLTPIETLLFIGYLGYLFVQRNIIDFTRAYFIAYFFYIYVVLNCLTYKGVVRFVVNLEMVIALFAVLMLKELFKSPDGYNKRCLLILSAIAIFAYNWFSFMRLFYEPSLLDPISYNLLELRHFIP